MSVLAYSELLKRITEIDENMLEQPFKILNATNTTPTRLKVIKALAIYEPISLGKLLQKVGLPRGGGSYITIRKYFLNLEHKGLLETVKENNKTRWKFSSQGEILKRYIRT